MTTWGEFRNQIRRTFLRDDVPDEGTGEYRFGNDELRDYMGWAQDTFAIHTALVKSITYNDTLHQMVSETAFALPDDLYTGEPLDVTGRVKVVTGSRIYYLDPIRYSDAVPYVEAQGFYTMGDTLKLTKPAGDGAELVVDYFAFYPRPIDDDDLILLPRWSEPAIGYLVAAHALNGIALQTANIRRWSAQPDTGNPEHNPVRDQSQWFFKQYDNEILRHPVQDRTNHFRTYE